MGQLCFTAFLGAELGKQRPVIVTEGQSRGQIVHRRLFIDLNIFFINVIEIAGAGLRDIVKQTQLQHSADISLLVKPRQGKADDGSTIGMLGH